MCVWIFIFIFIFYLSGSLDACSHFYLWPFNCYLCGFEKRTYPENSHFLHCLIKLAFFLIVCVFWSWLCSLFWSRLCSLFWSRLCSLSWSVRGKLSHCHCACVGQWFSCAGYYPFVRVYLMWESVPFSDAVQYIFSFSFWNNVLEYFHSIHLDLNV